MKWKAWKSPFFLISSWQMTFKPPCSALSSTSNKKIKNKSMSFLNLLRKQDSLDSKYAPFFQRVQKKHMQS